MKIRIVILTVVAALICSSYALASEMHDHSAHDKAAVKVGNELCPLSGQDINSMGSATEYEYNGKIYNLCCPGCADSFKEDPEKYSKIAEDSVKN